MKTILPSFCLGAVPPDSWYARLACRIVKANTFHWLGIIKGVEKYLTSESLGKGTSVAELSRYPWVWVYRLRRLTCEPSLEEMVTIHAEYGDAPYDMKVNVLTTLWFLLKHYLKIVIDVIKNHTWNCQEWVCHLSEELGIWVIGADEYPYCRNLEKSAELELMGIYDTREDRLYPATDPHYAVVESEYLKGYR